MSLFLVVPAYIDGFAQGDGLSCGGQGAGIGVAQVNLDSVAVATGHEQVAAVGREIEVTRMAARELIACGGEQSVAGVDGEEGYSLVLQAVGSVEESSVGTELYVGTPAGVYRVGLDGLL